MCEREALTDRYNLSWVRGIRMLLFSSLYFLIAATQALSLNQLHHCVHRHFHFVFLF